MKGGAQAGAWTGRRRGQAAVELAISLTAFVTLLLGALYLAEVGYLSLKVQEAATSALWDAAGRAQHDLTGGPDEARMRAPKLEAIALATQRSNQRYAGYDAFNRAGGLMQVMTRAGPLAVRCELDEGIADWAHGSGGGLPAESTAAANQRVYRETNAGLRCTAAGGFDALDGWRGTLRTCAVGRPGPDGECTGAFALLVDDWGFAGARESQSCHLRGCANPGLRAHVEAIYRATLPGGTPASDLARRLLRRPSPLDETAFRFSFAPGLPADPTYAVGEDQRTWATSPEGGREVPAYGAAYARRTARWLGKPDGWRPR